MGAQGWGDAGTRKAWAGWPPCALSVFAGLALLFFAPSAQASFHLIKVREVFPGTTLNPESDYVELQMYSSGQDLVNLGDLEVLDSTNTVTSHFSPAASVSHSANQSTVLIANTGFSTQFPSVSPDFTDEGLDLNPAGGAVCWPQNEPPFDDCASWGNFTGQASLPSPGDSSPAAAIPDGMALRRSISPGCPAFLENADDTNDSSVDFSTQTPEPRNNATTPVEHECPSLPNTAIDAKPANPTKATSASFTYHAIPALEAEFECRLDAAPFAICATGGTEYAGPLGAGSHSFEVRAVNTAGTDPTPAAYTWAIDTTPPQAKVKTHPEDPSPGNSAAFTYSSTETGSTFQCSLEPEAHAAAFSACASTGKTYPDAEHPAPLANGKWVFTVRATDKAGNQGTPAEFSWEVNNLLADMTPPETTIDSKPPDPSSSSTASFTYSSNEPGSSFQCMLDGTGFASCPASGITYTGLGDGPHSFQVKAIDPSDNADETPAGYSFTVVLGSPAMGEAVPSPPPSLPPPPPETKLLGKPAAKTHDRTPTFRFGPATPGTSFEYRLDRGPFKPCRSPYTTKTLSFGRHTIEVRAVLSGIRDSTPASFAFKVVKSK
ncbi:MAG TPA: hypothetical protein VHU14_00050 [Solirubrobacterales bacterium]|nr:hypothetical protein [Solirubrobacterales bacterium]